MKMGLIEQEQHGNKNKLQQKSHFIGRHTKLLNLKCRSTNYTLK